MCTEKGAGARTLGYAESESRRRAPQRTRTACLGVSSAPGSRSPGSRRPSSADTASSQAFCDSGVNGNKPQPPSRVKLPGCPSVLGVTLRQRADYITQRAAPAPADEGWESGLPLHPVANEDGPEYSVCPSRPLSKQPQSHPRLLRPGCPGLAFVGG